MPDADTAGEGAEPAPLEELSVPLELEPAPEPLAAEALLTSPDGGVFRIARLVWSEGGQRCYEGQRDSDGRSVWIREAWTPEGTVALGAESEIIALVHIRMIPERLASWESDGRAYVVTDIRLGPTMEEAWAARTLTLPQALSAITQVAYAVSRLHDAGWVHLGLRPAVVVPGKPACITRFNDSVHVGEGPRRTFYYSGYSPPEVFSGCAADPRMDIYALGALLFHAVNQTPMAETGAELSTFSPATPVGGVPQILHRCLGEPSTRYATAAELHQDLLKLLKRCSPRLRYEIASATNIGLEPSRKTNQDACGFLTGMSDGEDGPHDWAVLVLADGMGGMESGEVASQTAVRTLLRLAASNAPLISDARQRNTEIKRWIGEANEAVCVGLQQLHAHGGTTLVCALVSDGELISAHVGDSRIYLIRGGKAQILTRDHSLAMGLAMQGEIALEDVRHHPDRNKVTRSLGERMPLPEHYADTLDVCAGRPAIPIEPGDLLLLCSDGAWEPVTEEEITAVSDECTDLNVIAKRIVNLVLERGAPDNATVVLLRVHEESLEVRCNNDPV